MLRALVAVVALVAVASAFDGSLTEHWDLFKSVHNKQYKTPREESFRRTVFEGHVNYIARHNREYDLGKQSYSLGLNEYADLSHNEFVQMMNGLMPRKGNSTASATYMAPSHVGDLPDTVDWRTQGYVTPVKNQGQCGSCWAFSTTGSLEGQTFKKTKKLVSLSEQNLVDCSRAEGNLGCQGGLMDNGFKYIKTNGGIDTETSYPYTGKNGKCHYSTSNKGAEDTGFVDVKSKSEDDLKSAVATIGPISVAIDASHESFQLYRDGVYNQFLCSQTKLDHGVLAVGYGKNKGIFSEKDYWLVKNSWGATWGIKGYIMMSRNKNNQCGIATQASYPLV